MKPDPLRIFDAARDRSGIPRFIRDPITTTLHAAKVWLEKRIDDGAECPCCSQFAKVYKRKLNSGMAFVLVLMNRRVDSDWIHVPSYINAQVSDPVIAAAIVGDWPKMVHWGLIEKLIGERPDGSKRNGYYKITADGRRFARNKLRVPKHVWFYNDQMLDHEDSETVSIVEVFGGRFDYSELMRAK